MAVELHRREDDGGAVAVQEEHRGSGVGTVGAAVLRAATDRMIFHNAGMDNPYWSGSKRDPGGTVFDEELWRRDCELLAEAFAVLPADRAGVVYHSARLAPSGTNSGSPCSRSPRSAAGTCRG